MKRMNGKEVYVPAARLLAAAETGLPSITSVRAGQRPLVESLQKIVDRAERAGHDPKAEAGELKRCPIAILSAVRADTAALLDRISSVRKLMGKREARELLTGLLESQSQTEAIVGGPLAFEMTMIH